jgi:hypothetical protein
MSTGENISEFLAIQRQQYLDLRRDLGGSREGFRNHVWAAVKKDPLKGEALMMGAWMEAANRAWEKQPRKQGPDLFSIDGYTVPEHLTRPRYDDADDGEEADDADYEKVDSKYATVNDLYEDALIKMRNAARASAAAEIKMKAADVARRRAGGDLSKHLTDIADGK